MTVIGITYNPDDDLFYSGSNQCSIVLYEILSKLNVNDTKFVFINTKNNRKKWWDDFPEYPNVEYKTIYDEYNDNNDNNDNNVNNDSKIDVLIDVDGYVNPRYRVKIAPKTIVFLRTFLQFDELDKSVYYEKDFGIRNYEGVSEIWCWDILNPEETIPSIQTLYPCPIYRLPFIWSSTVIDNYTRHKYNAYNVENKWNVHIFEKNNTNTSSCILPIVAVKEMCNRKSINADYICYNMKPIIDNKFFTTNILNNIEHTSLPLKLVDKVHYYDICTKSNNIFFSHSRFIPLRISLIHILWLGIPIIHNSPILKNIHTILDRFYYNSNSITEICNVFEYFSNNVDEYYRAHNDIKKYITDNWSIQTNILKWKSLGIVKDLFNNTHNNTPIPEFIVGFTDMWDGYNYNTNFITDTLRNECEVLNIRMNIKGIQCDNNNITPNVLIFGPFSNNWKKIATSIPKVFLSSENIQHAEDDSISLYLTSNTNEDDKHLRIPVWMTFIDWFSTETTLTSLNVYDNPIRIPIHFALTPHKVSYSDRNEFCGFVVSNPICTFRNNTFHTINSYKRVNSGGGLFNNIGERLHLKYAGGGCGDISKYEFFSNHKFAISFENSQASGYITEKVLHSKMAGCIPLYWGDINTDIDFVKDSFINVSNIIDPKDVLKIIKELENDPDRCNRIASTPILNEEKKQKALRILSNMSQRILRLGGVTIPSNNYSQISKIYVINMESRKDRLVSLFKEEPHLETRITRISAVNGKHIKLNRFIYDLFKYNTFNWKKSIMGCSLSHMMTWTKILQENGEYFLILEDDVRFNKNWFSDWNKYATHIPHDAELLYLGGVLPPNKNTLTSVLEGVNKYWSIIKCNRLFSTVDRPMFHFCMYSYIITKAGINKLLQYIQNSDTKLCSPIDHILGNPDIGLKTYIATPLLTHCFQDNDPIYINSQFNNLLNINSYDSDIMNNIDCFDRDDIVEFL